MNTGGFTLAGRSSGCGQAGGRAFGRVLIGLHVLCGEVEEWSLSLDLVSGGCTVVEKLINKESDHNRAGAPSR